MLEKAYGKAGLASLLSGLCRPLAVPGLVSPLKVSQSPEIGSSGFLFPSWLVVPDLHTDPALGAASWHTSLLTLHKQAHPDLPSTPPHPNPTLALHQAASASFTKTYWPFEDKKSRYMLNFQH